MLINGIEENGYIGRMLSEYLSDKGYRAELIAVEYNGTILEKTAFGTTELKSGDTVEIVGFVGGG